MASSACGGLLHSHPEKNAEHRLAFWRTRWRLSAQVGVLAHRLASKALKKSRAARPSQALGPGVGLLAALVSAAGTPA